MSHEKARSVDLFNQLKKLNTTVTFLNTGAHPDDERSDLLSYLSLGLGLRTVTVNANRGEGGQNQIGTETDHALGVVRSKEMQRAAHILDIEAYHLSEIVNDTIYDHGLEKSKEKTLEKWGKTKTYERLIRKIREIKPDIIMPSFRDHDEEHGHHRVITEFTLKAFHDAANKAIFPEHFETGLNSWQAKKIYLPAETTQQTTLEVDIGNVDPLTGLTYPQIGEASRAFHRTQGMGDEIPAEPRSFRLELINTTETTEEDEQLFSGIPYNFYDYASKFTSQIIRNKLVRLQETLDLTVKTFPNEALILKHVENAISLVNELIDKITRLPINKSLKIELLNKLHTKLEQLNKIGFTAMNVEANLLTPETGITEGETQSIEVELTNHSDLLLPIVFTELSLEDGWSSDYSRGNISIRPKETRTFSMAITAPKAKQHFNPYDDGPLALFITIPYGHNTFTKIKSLDSFHLYRKLGVSLNEDQFVINTRSPQKQFSVEATVTNYEPKAKSATVRLATPKGWHVIEPYEVVHLAGKHSEATVSFTVIPPANMSLGNIHLQLEAYADGEIYNQTIQEITYDHIGTALYEYEATIKVTFLDLAVPKNLKIGYIDSGFDEVADMLIRCHLDVTKLSEIDLKYNDLSIYDTIVIGIRAFLSRKDLDKYYNRILQYIENGGHVVVQYHKPDDLAGINQIAPYPFTIGTPSIRWRVADENAKVTLTDPNSPLFSYPNRIRPSDWENWVQERGLYFPMTWSDEYETVVEIEEVGESVMSSGILLSRYGKGTFVYTNLVFHRQIQQQVAGGYRIFTNLLSYGKTISKTDLSIQDIPFKKRIS